MAKDKDKEIVIDLTLSDDESQSENELRNEISFDCPFNPPLNISGNILEYRHYKILKSHSAWFTDDIVNAFFCILQSKYKDKCFVFSSFFYESLLRKGKEYCLKHWTKDVKTFLSSSTNDKIVLFPVNSGGSHWVLLVWFVDEGTLKYYDSLMCKRSGNLIMKRIGEFFNEMKTEEVDIDKLLSNLSIGDEKDDETTVSGAENFPFIKNYLIPKGQGQQSDGSSCGPFCCLNGKSLLDTEKETIVDIYKFRESLIN